MHEFSPYIRSAWDSLLDKDIGPRVIFDYELLYIKSGRATITVEDRVYQAAQGDVFLFRPRIPHSITLRQGETITKVYIHFDAQTLPDAERVYDTDCLEDKLPPRDKALFRRDMIGEQIPYILDSFRPAHQAAFEQLLSQVIFIHGQEKTFVNLIREKQLFLQLLLEVVGQLQLHGKNSPKKGCLSVEPIRNYLDMHLHENVTLDQLAVHCNISKYYLHGIFRKAYKMTPHQYHQQGRMQKAQYLLRFTNMSVSEISASLGFDSLSVFCSLFKRIVGSTPSGYRLANAK